MKRLPALTVAGLALELALGSILATPLPAIASAQLRAASAPATITVTAVGDLMFAGAPGRLIAAKKDGRAPFTSVASRLRKADVTVGNLECPLSRRGTPVAGKTFTFRGDPRGVTGLNYAGFDLLSLANNHVRDYGGLALADTFTNLNKGGIAFAGAGKNRAAAWKPALITRRGSKIAYLAFSQIGPANFAATSTRSGAAFTTDRAGVKAAIRSAAKQADYVIVSFHWGVEKDYYCNSRQVADGRSAIDAGADLVLAHHPHVVQGVEYYKKKLIAYSLGNFVFSPGSSAGRDTMMLHITLAPRGVVKATAEPVYITVPGKPVMATGTQARRILGLVKKTSARRGTTVKIVGDTARLSP